MYEIKPADPQEVKPGLFKNKRLQAWIWLGASVLYTILPIDIIPDIPLIGWIDDFLLVSSAAFNVLQQETGVSNQFLARIARLLKWIMLGLCVLIFLVALLLGTLLVNLFTR